MIFTESTASAVCRPEGVIQAAGFVANDEQPLGTCAETGEYQGSCVPKLPWFAVRTRARAEKVASLQIRAQGIEEFLPLYQTRRQWFDRVKKVSLPLFSGYLFCRCDRTALTKVSSSSAVANVVGFGDEKASIPEHEIEAIRKLIGSGLSALPCPLLREGAMVRVRCGPLSGVRGRIVKVKGQYRLVISVEMLSRSVSVEVAPDIVEQI